MADKPSTDLDILDEHGAALRDDEKATKPKPAIFAYGDGYAYYDARGLLHTSPNRGYLEQQLGLVNAPLEAERKRRQEEADALAKRKAAAAERLPELRQRHADAKQASAEAAAAFTEAVRADPILQRWVELRVAEVAESRASGRVRRAQAQAAHGGEGLSAVMVHRWETLAAALDAVAQSAYSEESQG